MIKKIIIIFVMILLIPMSLALIQEKEKIPKITNKEELCINVSTGSGPDNFIKVYINGIQYKKIKLKDKREVEQIDASLGGIFDGCIKLNPGQNEVEVKYTYSETEKFTIEFDNTSPTLDISNIREFFSKTKGTFTTLISEPSILYISINKGSETEIEIKEDEVGNYDLTLPPEGEFKEGPNTIKIRVVDDVGNEEILEKTITVDTKEPEITINSVNGKPYTQGMVSKLIWVNIKGNTDTTNLEIYNLYNTDYYYLENKFLKSRTSTEEISELYKAEEITIEEGNFDVYVLLKPGKNKIVFLSEDSAGNKNIQEKGTDVDNINPTLIINFVSGENWELKGIRVMPEKLDSRDMLKKEGRATVEIRFSPKPGYEIKPEDIDLTEMSLSLTKKTEADPETFDNDMLSLPEGTDISYDKKKKEFVALQDVAINQLTGEITETNVRGSFEGKLAFYLKKAMRKRPITETIPIDLFFYIGVSDASYLNPNRIKWLSGQFEGSLKNIEKVVKILQVTTMGTAYTCAGLWTLDIALRLITGKGIPGKLKYGVCDRVICYDTPPKKKDLFKYPGATLGGISGGIPRPYIKPSNEVEKALRQAGAGTYDETKCAPNMLSKGDPLPFFSPVRVKDDLVESSKCLCLTSMQRHLQRVYSSLSALNGCLNQAKRGDKAPAECEVSMAQYSCDLFFGFINKLSLYKRAKDIFGRVDKKPFDTERGGWNTAKGMLELVATRSPTLNRVMSFNLVGEIVHQGCYQLASLNWDHISDVTLQTGLEAVPSFGKLIAKSQIEKKGEDLVIKYNIMPVFTSGLSTVQYDINFKCDPYSANGYLCQGYQSSQQGDYNSYLKSQAQDPPLRGVIDTNFDVPGIIPVEDGRADYWFNQIELTLSYSVSVAAAYPITRTMVSGIDHNNEGDLVNLCNEVGNVNKICKNLAYLLTPEIAIEGEEATPAEDVFIHEYPPEISITYPEQGDFISDFSVIGGEVYDANGFEEIKEINVYIAYKTNVFEKFEPTTNQKNSNTLSWSLGWSPSERGDYFMYITVIDDKDITHTSNTIKFEGYTD